MKNFRDFLLESFKCYEFKENNDLRINTNSLKKIEDGIIGINLFSFSCDDLDLLIMCLDSFLRSLTNYKHTRDKKLKEKAIQIVKNLISLAQKAKLEEC